MGFALAVWYVGHMIGRAPRGGPFIAYLRRSEPAPREGTRAMSFRVVGTGWASVATMCMLLAGCDVEPSDLHTRDAEAARMRSDGSPAGAGSGGSFQQPDPAGKMSLDIDAGPQGPLGAAGDQGSAGSAGSAGAELLPPKAGTTGGEADGGIDVDVDAMAGEDDGGAVAGGPCTDGTFPLGCAQITFVTKHDNTQIPLPGVAVAVSVDGRAFEAVSDERGQASIALPRGHTVWIRFSAAGYWTTEVPLDLADAVAGSNHDIYVLSDTYMTNFYLLFSAVPDVGLATLFVTFFPSFVGATVDVAQSVGGKAVRAQDSTELVLAPTLLNDAQVESMTLLNVHPGPLAPAVTVPNGTCEFDLPNLAYEAKPKTVTFFNYNCTRP